MYRLQQELACLSLVGAIALAPAVADAADPYRKPAPPPAPYAQAAAYVEADNWRGFYAGVNGGYGWGNGGEAISYTGGDSSTRARPEGGFGGGQLGYNFQSGKLVLGLETDFQGGDLSHSIAGTSTDGRAFTSSERTNWFGTVRGRLGLAAGRTLIFGTGGFAYGDVQQQATLDGVTLDGGGKTQTGWAAGGGIEYRFNPALSLKAEYQYIDLNGEKLSDGANLTTNSLGTSFHTARLGLNYRFGRSYRPLK